ncbi:ATP phosphoribosyltransferase regulatory subunit [Bienertia sinuspersici]
MAWNCRGLGTPITVNALRGVISTENPQVVLLSETKQIGKETKGIKQKLRFHGIIGVNCSGEGRRRSGALIWHFSPLRLEFWPGSFSLASDWVKSLGQVKKNVRWWSIVWGIWVKRNTWVFQKKRVEIQMVIEKAVHIAKEYEKATDRMKVSIPPRVERVGFGAVVRDFTRDVVVTTCMKVDGSLKAEVAEALAMRHALITTIQTGLLSLIIESYFLKLIKHLGKGCVDRNANNVAHRLAKLSKDYDDMRV